VTPIRRPEVVVEVGGLVDETRVTLGVYGPELEPDEISTLLGCTPTSAHRCGDLRRNGIPPWPQGAWLLSVEGKAPTGPEELIELLTARLPGESAIWERLTAKYSVRVTLGLFTGDWNRGFELSPSSISRLAAIGARVGFDIYADHEDNEDL